MFLMLALNVPMGLPCTTAILSLANFSTFGPHEDEDVVLLEGMPLSGFKH